ncbi:MAG: lipopolysaccharide biosynthesis protein [Pirellulaceae bacterium]
MTSDIDTNSNPPEPGRLAVSGTRAAFWTALERSGKQIIQFVLGILLARILTPEEFGLVGMLMIFMALAQVLVDSGFTSALIWKKQITRLEESSVFWFNLLVSVVLAILLCLSSPWIARFYEQAILQPLLCLLSTSLVLRGLGAVPSAMFIKALNFRPLVMASVPALLISGGIGIWMAMAGYGVWSLAVQYVLLAGIETAVLWMISSWRPLLTFSLSALSPLFNYGSKLLGTAMVDAFFRELFALVIGKFYSARSLGFYTRARSLYSLPAINFAAVASQVSFPLFSRMWGDDARVSRNYLKILGLVALIIAPLMLGMSAVADSLIVVLITEKWLPSAPLLRVLCIVGISYALSSVMMGFLKASGRTDAILKLELAKKSIGIVVLVATAPISLFAIVVVQAAASAIGLLLNMTAVALVARIGVWAQLVTIMPFILMASIMSACVWAVGTMPFSNDFWRLFVMTLSGISIYLLLVYVFRRSVFEQIVILAGNLKASKTTDKTTVQSAS